MGAPLVFVSAAALATSSALLFALEPMIARRLLPVFGGSPLVWNTCVTWFQVMLLAGYAYAHVLGSSRLTLQRQALVHLLVLAAPWAAFPSMLAAAPIATTGDNPVVTLLVVLTTSVGLPFFAVSTTAPLVQRWLSRTRHRDAGDPYFLYAASNVGAVLMLSLYPFAIERWIALDAQFSLWTRAYLVLAALVAGSAILAVRLASDREPEPTSRAPSEATPTVAQRTRWVVLALVPSSLLLSITTYLTTDVAAFPLAWMLPLSLYTASFILTFVKRPPLRRRWMRRALPLPALLVAVTLATEAVGPIVLLVIVHVVTFFIAAMVCHGELAHDRPAPRFLGEYYLWLALGGALGGAFNALLAPVIFDRMIEYPLMLVAACALRLRRGEGAKDQLQRKDGAAVLCTFVVTLGLVLGSARLGVPTDSVRFVFLLSAGVILAWQARPLRFAAAVGALLLASVAFTGVHGTPIARARTPYGALRITKVGDTIRLVHGRIIHGQQTRVDGRQCEPDIYYSRAGPAALVLDSVAGRSAASIAVIGLGVGELVAYSRPGQRWRFYELDPAVETFARDPTLFTFLSECAPDVALDIRIGDGRLLLAREPDGSFDRIVIDAFSSDAVPVHLLTREALAVYLAKLAPGGLVAFHISNLHLDLTSVVAGLASDAAAAGYGASHRLLADHELEMGTTASNWAVVARRTEDLAPFAANGWTALAPLAIRPAWTDDFANVTSVVSFGTVQ
jgi:spermidine synthase